jgi:hypothetical protein
MRTIQFNTASTRFQQIFATFCIFITKTCILLFFQILASKLNQLLITTETLSTNRFQREFHSNVAIATQEFFLASSHPRQKTNLPKPLASMFPSPNGGGVLSLRAAEKGLGVRFRAADSSASPCLCSSDLSGFRLAEMLFAEMLTRYTQTESKGNFCLITVYSHKTLFQPQAIRAKKQTF